MAIEMTPKALAFTGFVLQFLTQVALKFGWLGIEYDATTPMHEDLVTTLFVCTFLIVWAIEEIGKKREPKAPEKELERENHTARVVIKTWDEMAARYGMASREPAYKQYIFTGEANFTREMEKLLPGDRTITVERIGGSLIWEPKKGVKYTVTHEMIQYMEGARD